LSVNVGMPREVDWQGRLFQGILGIWVRVYKSSNSIVCGARS
jgi:hypothetical protein